MNQIKRVVIFGGTHGDEMSGIFLIDKWKKDKSQIQSRLPGCEIDLHISNPEAVALSKRYKDCDLNRQFSLETYKRARESVEPVPYEVARAESLHRMITEVGNEKKPQVLLDLHNTTSNMGCTLIVNREDDKFALHQAAYIKSKMESENYPCEILLLGKKAYGSSRSITKHGLGLEVGPQPQSVLRADILKIQQEAVFYALDFINKFNNGAEFPAVEIKMFEIFQKISFPKPYSPRTIMIHEDLQDKDFQPLYLSSPIFRTMDDKVLYLKDLIESQDFEEPVYPAFINEAAYYEKDLAFWLTQLKQVNLSSMVAL